MFILSFVDSYLRLLNNYLLGLDNINAKFVSDPLFPPLFSPVCAIAIKNVPFYFNTAKVHCHNLFAINSFNTEQPQPTGVENVFPPSLRN